MLAVRDAMNAVSAARFAADEASAWRWPPAGESSLPFVLCRVSQPLQRDDGSISSVHEY